jgi:hypothetical protein
MPFALMWRDSETHYPNCLYKKKSNTTNAPLVCKNDSLIKRDTLLISSIRIKKDTFLKKLFGDNLVFRKSFSEYANSRRSYLFGALYGICGMLLIMVGLFKITENNVKNVNSKAEWLKICAGLSMFLIIALPSIKGANQLWHNIATTIFFLFVSLSTLIVGNPIESKLVSFFRKFLAIPLLVQLLILVYFNKTTILMVEWIALLFIAIHLVLTTFKKRIK